MKNRSATAIFLFVLLAAAGCGEPEEAVSASSASSGADTIASPADSILVCSDTLSTDLAADYGIFLVNDIAASASGQLAILDGANSTVTVINSDGTAATAGGSGSGPGEFQWPLSLNISDHGIVAVSDFMSGIVRIYQPGLESYVDITGFIMSNPGALFPTGPESFAGMRVYFRTDDGETLIGHQAARWDGTDAEPSHVYSETMKPFDFNDFGASIVAPYPMTCSSQGVVFIAEVSTEKYSLTSYTAEGEVLWSVERPFERIEKTAEEIEIEEAMVTMRMQQSAHQTDYQADPYHFAVSSLALGPAGRLWAERPGHPNTFFDVFDPATGSYLFSGAASELYEKLVISPGGILAVPQGETQRLLLLELSPVSGD